MRRRLLPGALLAAVLASACPRVSAGAPENFHEMTLPDGSIDASKCGACHTDDMRLVGTKLETCTACHSQAEHSGTQEHLRADAARVAAAMAQRPDQAIAMPLAEDGRMFCGTCHLFHDPKVRGEAWLPSGWLPPDQGLPGAVRASVLDRWLALAQRHDVKDQLGEFAAHGTRMLRLPVSNGALCRQCHGAMR